MNDNTNLRAEAGRQLERLQRQNKTRALEQLKGMDPILFEHLSALLFEQRGFSTRVVGASGDEGVDVILRKGDLLAVAQCKRYDGSVGQPTVRDLYGTMIHNDASEAYLVTTGLITNQAQSWAAGKPIHFVDGFTLVDWIMASKPKRVLSPFGLSRKYGAEDGYVVTSDENGSGRSARIWLWPLAAILIVLFGVAVGVSYSKITTRLSDDGGPDGGAVATATTTATALPTALLTVAEATPGPTPLPTAGAPAEGAEPQATVVPLPCVTAPDAGFESLYNRAALGCATAPASIVWAAWEPFERGQMLWRSDTDVAYVLGGQTGGEWAEVAERWDGASEASRGSPPPGLQAPVRGFGYVWGIRDDLFRSLGWATDAEKGFCAAIQSFESGFILQSSPVASCTVDGLYNRAAAADWRPLTLIMFARPDRRWSVARPDVDESDDVGSLQEGGARADGGSPGGAERVESRPRQQGIFSAARLDGIRMDGNLDEWRGFWFPINHIVHGAAEWFGTADLDGEFQARWSDEDLIVAVRVRDERYRGGPPGTNMWQGDGLELHFDRLLAADFDDPESNADDYQIGIGIEPGLNNLPGYRWLPYDGERSLAFPGAGMANPQGLTLEVAIPWTVFDVQPAQIAAGQRFGFNLSINDNDGDAPAQQTTASASPARTNHQTPTQWGTLVLVEGGR